MQSRGIKIDSFANWSYWKDIVVHSSPPTIWLGICKGQWALHAELLLEMEDLPDTLEGIIWDEEECYIITQVEDQLDFGNTKIANFLKNMEFSFHSNAQH
jgi:hypothetical protein